MITVYRSAPQNLRSAIDTWKVWKWDDAAIETAIEWAKWFSPATQAALTYLGIHALDEVSPNEELFHQSDWERIKFYFDTFKVSQCVDLIVPVVTLPDGRYSAEFINSLTPAPRWPTLYTSDGKVAYIWLSSKLSEISDEFWLKCGQDRSCFQTAQKAVAKIYSTESRFDSGWNCETHFRARLSQVLGL